MQSIRTKYFPLWHHFVLMALLLLVLCTRYVPGVGEWYATELYPLLSSVLSFLSSAVPISFEEVIVLLSAAVIILYPIIAAAGHRGWRRILLFETEFACWLYVWFYLGWGCNYYRSDFYSRCQVERVQVDTVFFKGYLQDFASSINACYPDVFTIEADDAERMIKSEYCKLPEAYGLCRPKDYQQPKYVLFNRLYSAVGVLGYMGPFMAESQLNLQLLPDQYPFTYAHELAHLLGVSSEAEANYWAYKVCISSDNRFLQYCGYYGLLPYLANNAHAILEPEDYQHWIASLDPRIIEDQRIKSEFWSAQQIGWINDAQEWFYDWYLKSNHIPSGKANYSMVVQMVLSERLKQVDN